MTSYVGRAAGTMTAAPGSGRFVCVILRPEVRVAGGDPARALALHEDAHALCFIANSVSVPVVVQPAVVT